jgi:glycosyltransferase involved in cell wall biosynthesis/tetratricopeptide (TPR) repeat protein
MSPTQPFLGVYLIVRDEEKVIDRLLASLKDRHGDWAFDEIVIVDTGSTDSTRQRIAAALSTNAEGWSYSHGGNVGAGTVTGADGRRCDVRLARFEWRDDFAAARNYAFSLGTAKWRLWLDADDELSLNVPEAERTGDTAAEQLRRALVHTDTTQPNANVVMLPYDYAPPLVSQDKYRVMRWADGWAWTGEIHEEIVPKPMHQRVIADYKQLKVVHQAGRDPMRSIQRNTRICNGLHADASIEGNVVKAAKMAYYLGQYARLEGDRDRATRYYTEAGNGLGLTNMAAYAWVELAQLYIQGGLYHDAVRFAGNAIARCPEIPDGYAVMGVALERMSERDGANLLRAITVFETLWALPQAAFQSTYDRLWIDGLVPISAARAYLRMGRLSQADVALKRLWQDVAEHPEVEPLARRVSSDFYKAVGLVRLHDLADFLVWNNEPVKALELLRTLAPSNVQALPAISAMQKAITDKMQQLDSWADYKRVYAAETNEVFDRDEAALAPIREQGRSQYTKRWAESLPKDGPPIELYVVGIHGGWIEEAVMDANPRIRLTACDVNPNANSAIQRLLAKFPGRVAFHKVERHHCDWTPAGKANAYDVVFCFEVIEHVPDDERMVEEFLSLLKPGGELFLSTPIAEYWVAPDATKRHHWHQHVRAYQPEQLWDLLWRHGFRGDIFATDHRVLHLCHLHLADDMGGLVHALRIKDGSAKEPAWMNAPRVTIWIPNAPQPFDPQSPRTGHVGGSEEAVIHLAPWLAQLGARVEVYGRPVDSEFKAHVVSSVIWRPLEEFDPARLTGAVLVWRSPRHAAWLKKENPRLRVLNWLHDTSYGATPDDYATVDGTIVLSQFHAEAIAENDGFDGPFLFAANGIEPGDWAFDKEAERDPNLVIYSSAPNRGLDLLLEAWPRIHAEVPTAKLEIFYGWEITRQMMAANPQLNAELGPLLEKLERAFIDLADKGVTYRGGVGHDELHGAFRRASVWAYPVYSFDEIFCITAIKAQAAGAWPVVMDRGAIPEVVQYGTLLSTTVSRDGRGTEEEEQRSLLRDDLINGVIRAIRRGNGSKLKNEEVVLGWHYDGLDCEGDVRAYIDEQRAQVCAKWTWENAAKLFMKHLVAPKLSITIDARSSMSFDHESLHNPRGRNVGGSEEAVIVLAGVLAERGVDVTVHHQAPVAGDSLVKHVGTATWISDGRGIKPPANAAEAKRPVVAFRNPAVAAALKSYGYKNVILWLMDPTCEVTSEEWDAADEVVCLTMAHEDMLPLAGTTTIIHNGLLLNELPPLSTQNDLGRHPEWVMWSVSPDRGLHHLLRIWPDIKAAVPNAQLHIFYGLEGCFARAKADRSYAIQYGLDYVEDTLGAWKETGLMERLGVHYHGSTPRSEYIAQHVRCGTWAYTNDKFSETFCMSMVRALACGMTPVFTVNGALPEVLERVEGCGTFKVQPENWKDFQATLITAMTNPPSFALRKSIADKTRAVFSAEAMATEFIRLLTRLTEEA